MRMNCIELSGVSENFVAPSNWRIKVLASGMAVFSPPTMEPVFPVHESTPGLYFLNAIDTIFPVSGSVTIEFSPASAVILVENKNLSPLLSRRLMSEVFVIFGAVSLVRFRYFRSSENTRTPISANPAPTGATIERVFPMTDGMSDGPTTSYGTKESGTESGTSIISG